MISRRTQARTSISTWLWALVLLPTLPLMGFFGYSVHQYADERQRSMEARLVDQANDLANTAQSRLEQSLGALTAMSLSNAAQEDNIPRLYSASQRIQQASPAMAAISLVDRDEKLVFLSLSPMGTTLPVAQLDSVRETFKTGKPSLSKPFQSPVSSRKIAALNVPVIRDGQVVYVLRGILRVETLSNLINPQGLPPGWIAGIFDRDGITVARSLSPEIYVGKVAGPRLLNTIKTQDLSVQRGVTRDGIDTLTVMRPIGQWQWSVAVSVPMATINAPLRTELQRFGAFTVVFLMILAATVYRMNRLITGRLSEVVQDARQALSGQLRKIDSTGIRELDDLRYSLTRADIYRNVILEQVEQRTAELNRAQAQLAEFAQKLDDNIERERLRISREVHDQIGAIFTGVSMLVSGLPKGAMSEEQRSSVNQALDFGMATARRITAELRPPLLDHLGLAAAVEDMAKQVLVPASIEVRIEISDASRLSSRKAIGCYRIMQEAITNALRHSRCRRFEITGTAEDALYTFVIEDDGEGIKAASAAPGHFGMTGMQERARMMGGELQVTSQPGEGVRIRVTVPLDAATDE
ncbi:hypothetical protein J7U46_22905 [Pelomonas sp. V22]|uniref:sensor histidine kinase n=1 Tax=Pelomonas sp. V22 TaxID=2822139 RepID=UPI0024A85836|nr:cache domain-containing protein [Pelomonas sp. V22]MDI4635921.1 hypothetical protein [Pelomonas sp. V22]